MTEKSQSQRRPGKTILVGASAITVGIVVALFFALRTSSSESQSHPPVAGSGSVIQPGPRAPTIDRPMLQGKPRSPTVSVALGLESTGSQVNDENGAKPAHALEADHPGFLAAYQKAVTAVDPRLIFQCAQVLVAQDENDQRARDWEYLDTYEKAADGSMHLTAVDIPSGKEEDVAFLDCLKEERLKASITIPSTDVADLPDTLSVRDAGRYGGYKPTQATLPGMIASLEEQLESQGADDPNRVALEATLLVFRCYAARGTGQAQRIECLKLGGVTPE